MNDDTAPASTSPHTERQPSVRIDEIHATVFAWLRRYGVRFGLPEHGIIRPASLLYMVYWSHRLRNNPEEQKRVRRNLIEYFGTTADDPTVIAGLLFTDKHLLELAMEYVQTLLLPTPTVDLVIMRASGEDEKDREVLCIERTYYPLGPALPGGLIRDDDEDNALGLTAPVYAALRVAGEKVLRLKAGEERYTRECDERGLESFLVRGVTEQPAIRMYTEDEGGYRFRENIRSVLRPSDPRHIVDTIAYKCEMIGDAQTGLAWRKRSEIMSTDPAARSFAFGHHREIVAYITAQTSVEKERKLKERTFIRGLIDRPLESYRAFKCREATSGDSAMTSYPELFPVVDRLLTEAFSLEINALCEEQPLLAGIRDKAVINLRHVCLKNRTFCPKLPTLLAITGAIAFFDVVARHKRGFYAGMAKDCIVEHDPSTTPFASYHMYRYKYRFDQLVMGMVKGEFVIPTFEEFTAEDLMRLRGSRIRIIGLSTDFLYVDEFEQSPEEFAGHDANHAWRMIMEDVAALGAYSWTEDQLAEQQCKFIDEYLGRIRIRASDTEEQREIKKIKKIILFEITHEDARVFLRDVICRCIQIKEGGSVPFEVPHIDRHTGYMDVVDTLDTGISTLSYVRCKLQHGFYDRIDAVQPQIVDPKYRTAEWIARAAYEMLVELDATPAPEAELDEHSRTSYEWLLRRTCAVGPDNIHEATVLDAAVAEHGDGAERLNPKRYHIGT